MLFFLSALVLADSPSSWMGYLRLDIEKDGGQFLLQGTTTEKTAVTLPGNKGLWPFSISAQGTSLPTIAFDERPHTELEAGEHTIIGDFSWSEIPTQIRIPDNISHLDLYVQKKKIHHPIIQNEDLLLLHPPQEAPQVSLSVKRTIVDLHPTQIQTDIQMHIVGSPQKRSIPFPSLGNDAITQIESSLSVWVEDDAIWCHTRPGNHHIQLKTQTHQTSLLVPQTPLPWPKEETWLLPSQKKIQVAQEQTIDLAPQPLQKRLLSLQKNIWLTDKHLYVEDQLHGFSSEAITLSPSTQSASIRQLTPPQPQNEAGEIVVRDSDIQLQIDRQTQRHTVHTIGWKDLDLQSLSFRLHHPSNWKLLYISGLQISPFYRLWFPQLFLWIGVFGMLLWRAPKKWSILGGICLSLVAVEQPYFLLFVALLLLLKPLLQAQNQRTQLFFALLYATFIAYIVHQDFFSPVQILEKELLVSPKHERVLHLYWIDPFYNILRMLIFAPLFSFCLWKAMKRRLTALAALLISSSFLSVPAHAEDFCTPQCTDAPLLSLHVEGETLKMEGELHAIRKGEWPLPGPIQTFRPHSITLNGEPYYATRKEKNGHIYILLEPGVWHFKATGTIKEPLYLHFPQKVQQLNFYSKTYQIEGLHPNRSHESYLMLSQKEQTSKRFNYGTLKQEILFSQNTTIQYIFERNPNFSLPLVLHLPSINGENEEQYPSQEIPLPPHIHKHTWSIEFPTVQSLAIAPSKNDSITEQWILQCGDEWLCERNEKPFQEEHHSPTDSSSFSFQALRTFPNPLLSKGGQYKIWEDEVYIHQMLHFSFRAPGEGHLPVHFGTQPSNVSLLHNDKKKGFANTLPYTNGNNEYRLTWSSPLSEPTSHPPIPQFEIIFEQLSLSMESEQRVLLPLSPQFVYKYLFALMLIAVFSLLLARNPLSQLRFREWLLLLCGATYLHWMLPFALVFALFLFSSNVMKELPSGLFILSLITALYYAPQDQTIRMLQLSDIPNLYYAGFPYWTRDLLLFVWCLWTLFVLRRIIFDLPKQAMEVGGGQPR